MLFVSIDILGRAASRFIGRMIRGRIDHGRAYVASNGDFIHTNFDKVS